MNTNYVLSFISGDYSRIGLNILVGKLKERDHLEKQV
jgi:hypothetical protein